MTGLGGLVGFGRRSTYGNASLVMGGRCVWLALIVLEVNGSVFLVQGNIVRSGSYDVTSHRVAAGFGDALNL
ncbi:hypothetical protein DEU56DRAFT_827202 [Suillus clintonianus]|uniref:uncharacterized protein n=1 Tax=Suillus clintonianus TaxID=1904413 RepID=UPI001B86696F|nr:uncharacterized protein DEU56DRAFT_827202 [Suillus clintonianus]KAG2124624.1 hypothetical protein DEU56DRAFT_827202 [Suillus clintonianus]